MQAADPHFRILYEPCAILGLARECLPHKAHDTKPCSLGTWSVDRATCVHGQFLLLEEALQTDTRESSNVSCPIWRA
jgi:hypothetical protein